MCMELRFEFYIFGSAILYISLYVFSASVAAIILIGIEKMSAFCVANKQHHIF